MAESLGRTNAGSKRLDELLPVPHLQRPSKFHALNHTEESFGGLLPLHKRLLPGGVDANPRWIDGEPALREMCGLALAPS
jgi:hypothetical protein